jgi:hypothetical protein
MRQVEKMIREKHKQKNLLKKSQVEIMGVAVIVLLISVALLFIISFKTNQAANTPNPVVSYSNDQLGTNFLSAALKTNVCPAYKLEDLISACGKGAEQACTEPGPGVPCNDANEAITAMLEKSLDDWNVPYIFSIQYPDTTKNFERHYECAANQQRYRSAEFYIPLYQTGQTIIVSLTVCK